MLKYTLTNDTITIVHNGKTHTIKKGTPNFIGLRQTILDKKWDEVPKHLTMKMSIENWANGRFSLDGDNLTFDGDPIPQQFNKRIFDMVTNGESPEPLLRFYERLQNNPSKRAVDSLYGFLQYNGIPINEEGYFLAYKGVDKNYKDCHTKTFDNKPGAVHSIPRNKVSDDPRVECGIGFHVGSLKYALGFGPNCVITKVDPADVVEVPYEETSWKCRVCHYEVVGHYSGELPSTTIPENYDAVDDENDDESNEDENDENDDESNESNKNDDESNENDENDDESNEDENDDVIRISGQRSRKKHPFDNLSVGDLLEKSIRDLRAYAAKTLLIIGATKIIGGKTALINAILKVRDI